MKDFLKLMTVSASTGLLFALMLSACQRTGIDNALNGELSSDNSRAEFVSDDAENMANAAVLGIPGFLIKENHIGSCAVVTNDTINHVVTIDFGTVNCECMDGRMRRGKIIINYSGHYFDVGSVKNFSFDNYFVDDNHIEGTRVVTNLGVNGAGNFHWSVISNLTITKPDGRTMNWSRAGDREMIAGAGTETIWDDEYAITGTASGTRGDGNSFTATITSALHRSLSCHFITSGTIEITPANHPPLTIDFGNGNCDALATITCNGHSHEIQLH